MYVRALAFVACLLSSVSAFAADVSFPAVDGVLLHGVEYGKGNRGVVLLHDRGRSNADWAYFGDKLGGLGFHVLALDLRGHGASKPPDTVADADYLKMAADVQAAVLWLRGKGAGEVQLVGANLGANLALTAAAEDAQIKAVALLSPGLNIAGVTLGQAVFDKYGKRPMLMMVGTENNYELRTITYIEEHAQGEHPVEVLDKAGSGVKMLNKVPDADTNLVAWLNGTYGKAAETTGPTKAISTGDTSADSMKTSGKKFGQ
jgi:pimeloyl-ACP methyl ester carboxylesterase